MMNRIPLWTIWKSANCSSDPAQASPPLQEASTRTSLGVGICLLLAVLLAPASAAAQALGLAPAQVVQKFKPGSAFEFQLASVDNGDTPVEVSVQITDFWYNEKNEKVFSPPGTSPRSAANWIQFVPEHFEIPAHGTQRMRAIVTPPADAVGGYYAVLFVQSKPVLTNQLTKDGKSVFANVRVGCLVLLTAEGTETYKIGLENVNLTPPSGNQGLNLTFDVANDGNTHVFPQGRLAVLDSNRKLVAKAESEMLRTLPGQKNPFQIYWTGSLPPGNYTGILTVTYGESSVETRAIPFTVAAQ